MAKMTMLQMVQNILSAMNSDTVDTILATDESSQVAQHIEDVYAKMMTEKDWPHLQVLSQLVGLGDVTMPTRMQMPTDVTDINWIRYDSRVNSTAPRLMRDIKYLPPVEFIDRITNRALQTNVVAYTDVLSNVVLHVYNDRAPIYWTSFDDDYIWFDAFDSSLEATLQQSKSIIHVIKEPVFNASDAFVPDLPSHMFPALLAAAKGTCFNYIKQQPAALEERDSRRQRVALQEKGRKEQQGNKRSIHYGRR
jgi:hypothetical protein